MENSIDLKLNVKNFSGTLENGKRYRVLSKTAFSKSLNEFQLFLYVDELFDETSEGREIWLTNRELNVLKWFKKGITK